MTEKYFSKTKLFKNIPLSKLILPMFYTRKLYKLKPIRSNHFAKQIASPILKEVILLWNNFWHCESKQFWLGDDATSLAQHCHVTRGTISSSQVKIWYQYPLRTNQTWWTHSELKRKTWDIQNANFLARLRPKQSFDDQLFTKIRK